jgi:Fungal specific transcription factor domain
VKCGEEKPECQRCRKFGIKCDGYLPLHEDLKKSASNRGILPRTQKLSEMSPNFLVPLSVMSFGTEKEQRYFDLFYGQTSFEIMPAHDSFSTRQMLLQACYSNSSIKHAIIALGALDKTAEITRDFNKLSLDNFPKAERITANEHHQFALEEYTKAVADMRRGITLKDVRTSLLSILLVFIFEAWNGNMAMAVLQIRNGVRIIQEWKATIKDAEKTSENMSPAPHIVEHDLIRIFSRLVIQTSYFYSQGSTFEDLRTIYANQGREYLESMPAYFTTIEESVHYHQAIYKRGTLFFAAFITEPPLPGSDYALELASEQSFTITKTTQYLKAFQPLFDVFKTGHSVCEGRLVRTIKAQIMICDLMIRTFFMDQTVYDLYNNTFSEIVDLLEQSLEMQPATGRSRPTNYSLAGRVVSTLWITGIRCRDRAIRRKAIGLLLKYPRREGVWDGHFSAKIMKFVMDLEEQYLEDDYVPGWARISAIRWDADLEKRAATLICEQRVSNSSDEVVMRTRTIIW